MSHLKTGESAQAIALAAVAMIAVVGAVALVIDMGFFLETRRQLQNSSDSAALAGVIYLPNCATDTGGSCASPTNANDAAMQVVGHNGRITRHLCGPPA